MFMEKLELELQQTFRPYLLQLQEAASFHSRSKQLSHALYYISTDWSKLQIEKLRLLL